MTTRDYEIIAACIGAAYKHFYLPLPRTDYQAQMRAISDLKSRLELEFSLENPRFDKDKFQSRINYWFDQHDGR